MAKYKVYTSLENFYSDKFDVRSYKELSETFSEWVDENAVKLLGKRSPIELFALHTLEKAYGMVYSQPFFMIFGRSYFLDCYIPELKIAVEIDGKCHKDRRDLDKTRDKDFAVLGIKTIRIKASNVTETRLLKSVNNANKSLRKTKRKRGVQHVRRLTAEEKREKIIKKAMERVKEHDKNKHKAKWI